MKSIPCLWQRNTQPGAPLPDVVGGEDTESRDVFREHRQFYSLLCELVQVAQIIIITGEKEEKECIWVKHLIYAVLSMYLMLDSLHHLDIYLLLPDIVLLMTLPISLTSLGNIYLGERRTLSSSMISAP